MATPYYPNTQCGPSQSFVPYACSPCPVKEAARVSSWALLEESLIATFDFSSPSDWATAIANNQAFVYWQVNGEYDGGTTEKVDGYGRNALENGNTTHVITVFDRNVIGNVDHWNYVKSRTDLVPVIITDTRLWAFTEPANIEVKMPIANDLKAFVQHNVILTLVQNDLPLDYAIPAGIFTQCYIQEAA